ncbi:hypothetical protein C922_05708 [Plasmodium inui San Antonio 1]|uniref:Uncharacterized protein n=1 Tax=Plasmodium inui San Antonio 1 TaxID=1237626 RepID=W7AF52_9APIC|nr:hypothetical protein C922_05708 [Plasmodium inui San Antonio 1]EUD63911.1 hypothetical protein C922_05708 [Plasmodium inui San Antonio 1]
MGQKGFPFSRYMQHLLDEGTKGRCQKGSEASDSRLCRIRQGKFDTAEKDEWSEEYIRSGEGSDVNAIIRSSHSVCKNIEQWAMHLVRTGDAADTFEESPDCSIDGLGLNLRGGTATGKCRSEGISPEWIEYTPQNGLSKNSSSWKRLRVCQDIVEMIVEVFRIGYGQAEFQIAEQEEGGLCESIYRKLETWGGPKVAKMIMKGWYTQQVKIETGGQGYIIKGKDFFELVQEIIWGSNKADKVFGCKPCQETSKIQGPKGLHWCDMRLSGDIQSVTEITGQNTTKRDSTSTAGQEVSRVSSNSQPGTTPMGSDGAGRSSATVSKEGQDLAQGELGSKAGVSSTGSGVMEGTGGTGGLISGVLGGGASVVLGLGAGYGLYRIFRRNRVGSTSERKSGTSRTLGYSRR